MRNNTEKAMQVVELEFRTRSDAGFEGYLSSTISINDDMFQGDSQAYFRIGLESLEIIERNSIISNGWDYRKVILVLPSGHGRELRFIKARYPKARIVACDIEEDAVEFCKKVLNCEPLLSNMDFKLLQIPLNCDVIWVGSLITHLSSQRTESLVSKLWSSLKPGGTLFFSSHGQYVADILNEGPNYGLEEESSKLLLKNYYGSGYGYANYPGRENYGISVITEKWIRNFVSSLKPICEMSFLPREWDQHQDVICLSQK
jgi:SAM-dependent methyltransferase